jgi:hypothetical protein
MAAAAAAATAAAATELQARPLLEILCRILRRPYIQTRPSLAAAADTHILQAETRQFISNKTKWPFLFTL